MRLDATGEVDLDKFEATAPFVVYFHKRPDGSVFYVGKGKRHRAHEFSPSRRTEWHRNVVQKHGRENIIVETIPCENETIAFGLERIHIAIAKERGEKLVNLTDGGEGKSGHTPSEKQLLALKEWQGAFHRLNDDAQARVLDGLRKGREKVANGWKKSPEGIAHLKRLAEAGKARLHAEHEKTCPECGKKFLSRSAKKVVYCSKLCYQHMYRRKQKENGSSK